jgi:hypothetical protein
MKKFSPLIHGRFLAYPTLLTGFVATMASMLAVSCILTQELPHDGSQQ